MRETHSREENPCAFIYEQNEKINRQNGIVMSRVRERSKTDVYVYKDYSNLNSEKVHPTHSRTFNELLLKRDRETSVTLKTPRI